MRQPSHSVAVSVMFGRHRHHCFATCEGCGEQANDGLALTIDGQPRGWVHDDATCKTKVLDKVQDGTYPEK